MRVQIGWGYGFDVHRGRHMLEGLSHSSTKIAMLVLSPVMSHRGLMHGCVTSLANC